MKIKTNFINFSEVAYHNPVVAYLAYLSVIYLTTLSVAHNIWHQMTGWLMSNELERNWKEAVMVTFRILFQHLPGETEENHSWDS
jgi:hypothetical protein